MADTLWVTIVGGLAGIVTGGISSLIAPWANWGIEKRKQKLAHRRELIAKWREMIKEAVQQEKPLVEFLERHKDYYSLKPHLRQGIHAGERTFTVGASVDTPVLLLIDEIARIEREWKLI